MPGSAETRYVALPEFPPVERDIALLLMKGILGDQVERVIRARAGNWLEDLRPFDQYAGEGLPEGARSVAWRLRFRHPERTLTDAEVDETMSDVVRGLREELNVERR
jgi:phenylalanyl-tRNA synthetase beta chain